MSIENSLILCLDDNFIQDPSQFIDIRVFSAKNFQIPFYNFFKFSEILLQEHILNEIKKLIISMANQIIEDKPIDDESFEIFVKLMKGKKVEISCTNYWDLYKLSEIFQIKQLKISKL